MTYPFDPRAKLVIVPTRLWGATGDIVVNLAVDTGATRTLINWDVIVFLGYDPAASAERVQITTGSGVEFVPRVRLERIQGLGTEQRDFEVLCHTLPRVLPLMGSSVWIFFVTRN